MKKMLDLFEERKTYDSILIQQKENLAKTNTLRYLCYISTMLGFDEVVEGCFENNWLTAINQCKEENFMFWHYEDLILIFPNAKNVLNKNKFLN